MFKKAIQNIDRVIERVSYYGVFLSGILAVLMAFLATYGVIRRYIFHNPEPYSYELSTMFLVAGVVLAIPYIQKVGRHLRVDIVADRFPEGVQIALLNILVPLLALFYLVPLTWYAWDNSLYALQVTEKTYSAWAPITFPVKVLVPIGVGMLCLVLLIQFIHGIFLVKERIAKKRQ